MQHNIKMCNYHQVLQEIKLDSHLDELTILLPKWQIRILYKIISIV
jgi:hypothetical protein